ncbi:CARDIOMYOPATHY-ASSOCIATED PROTEIN, partial [Salix purpurea]
MQRVSKNNILCFKIQEMRILTMTILWESFIATQNGYLEFSQESSWKRAYHDDDDDEASDSGSDGVESSSPDASMADILPMLDELHPLLDEEAPQPANISNDGSDAGSEGSHKSDESSIESEEDVGNQ